ncbi:MAG: hypothetical protein WAO19_01125 [Candidatus Kryptoniota bacterium]
MIISQIVIIILQATLVVLMVLYKGLIGHQLDKKLEKFKQDFQKELFEQERKDKFKLAALDERLKAHQEAYAMVYQMLKMAGSDSKGDIQKVRQNYEEIVEARTLYLSPEVVGALNIAKANFEKYNYLWRNSDSNQTNLANKMDDSYQSMIGSLQRIAEATTSETNPELSTILPEKPKRK